MTSRGSILVFGHPDSPLVAERATVGARGGYETWWYVFGPAPERFRDLDGLSGFIAAPQVERGGHVLTKAHLAATFLRRQPCIAHVHYALMDREYVGWVSRLRPLVVSAMGGDVDPEQGFRGADVRAARRLLDHADIITSKSRFMDEQLLRIGAYGHKIRRVSWGVDLSRFRPGEPSAALRRRLKAGDDDVLFFCARACEPRLLKHVVVESFARARESFARPAKLIVSEFNPDPVYLERLHRLVDELGIADDVRFVGALSSTDMPEYFVTADAVVSVPRRDGMPQTVFQALACGAPLILSDIPQIVELLDAGCAVDLVPVGEVEALAAVMVAVAADPQARREAALANREKVTALADRETQVAAMNRIYDELLPRTLGGRLGR